MTTAARTPGRANAGGAGRRPKHVPQRMCVACRERDAKRALIRVVRTPEGAVEIDPTGKRNGRGAYLCGRPGCWDRALVTNALARALNTTMTPETLELLRHYAAGLSTPAEMVEQPAATEQAKG